MLNHTWLSKSGTMLYFSDQSNMIFSRNVMEQVFLTNQKLEINMSKIFKTKCIVNFMEVLKKFRSGGVTMAKSNKTEKNWRTDNRVSGSRMSLECFPENSKSMVILPLKPTFNPFPSPSNYDSSKSSFLVRIY